MPRERQHEAWAYGIEEPGRTNGVRCGFCMKVVSGIHRFAHHLAGYGTQVTHCEKVSDDIRRHFRVLAEREELERDEQRERQRERKRLRHFSGDSGASTSTAPPPPPAPRPRPSTSTVPAPPEVPRPPSRRARAVDAVRTCFASRDIEHDFVHDPIFVEMANSLRDLTLQEPLPTRLELDFGVAELDEDEGEGGGGGGDPHKSESDTSFGSGFTTDGGEVD